MTLLERRRRTEQKSQWKTLYNLSPEQRAEIRLRQRGVCPGCGKSLDEVKETIDHVHDNTKRVRGILCNHCNLVIGHAYENPEVLRSLAFYLEVMGHV
jgi:hypothetical protein